MNEPFNRRGRRLIASAMAWSVAAVLLADARIALAQDPDGDQPSRSSLLEAERQARTRDLSPPKRNLVERAMYWYDNRDGRLRWHGIHFAAGGFNSGAGFGYGIGFTKEAIGSALADAMQPNRVDVSMLAARSARGYKRFAAAIDLLNVAGAPVDMRARWQDYDNPQEVFFGMGPDSSVDDRTTYRVDGAEAGLDLRWRPSPTLTVGGGASMLTTLMADGTDGRYPSALDVHAGAPGIAGLPDFLRGDLSIAFDSRDSASHPRQGGRYAAMFSLFDGRGGATFDFRRLAVETQQLVPLGNRYRRFEWRAAGVFTLAGDASTVPAIFQPTLGGVRSLRGFHDGRFRDRHAVAASAEYQWEAWWALDAAVFVDAGQVFNQLQSFAFDRFDYSYGLGFRLHSNSAFLARLDLAFSREGFVPLLGFRYGF